jgi:hypothetical protein
MEGCSQSSALLHMISGLRGTLTVFSREARLRVQREHRNTPRLLGTPTAAPTASPRASFVLAVGTVRAIMVVLERPETDSC